MMAIILALALMVPVAGGSSALKDFSHKQYEQSVKAGFVGSYRDWQMASGLEKWGKR